MDILGRFEQFVSRRCARGNPSPHTVRSYRTQARMWLGWCAGRGLDPLVATEEDVVSYRAELVGRYAEATVALKLQVVATLYEALGVEPNPAEKVRPPRDGTPPEERIEYLTVDQVRAIFAAVGALEDPVRRARDRAMVGLLVTFGLRAQELRGLELCDVILLKRKPGRLVIRSGKGRKRRTLHLTVETAAMVRDWLAVRPVGGRSLFVGLTGRGALSDSGLRKVVKAHLRAAGVDVDGQACHVFRHTAITLAVAFGAARAHVQRMAGHADPRTTDLYVHLVEAERENPALIVEAALAA